MFSKVPVRPLAEDSRIGGLSSMRDQFVAFLSRGGIGDLASRARKPAGLGTFYVF